MDTLPDNTLLTANAWQYGHFSFSDRFAIVKADAMRAYCQIGKDRNFLAMEHTEYWKEHKLRRYNLIGAEHEDHVAMWLMHNDINFERRAFLDGEYSY